MAMIDGSSEDCQGDKTPGRSTGSCWQRIEEAGAGSIKMRANMRLRMDQYACSVQHRTSSFADRRSSDSCKSLRDDGRACGTAPAEAAVGREHQREFMYLQRSKCQATCGEQRGAWIKGPDRPCSMYAWTDPYSHVRCCTWG